MKVNCYSLWKVSMIFEMCVNDGILELYGMVENENTNESEEHWGSSEKLPPISEYIDQSIKQRKSFQVTCL